MRVLDFGWLLVLWCTLAGGCAAVQRPPIRSNMSAEAMDSGVRQVFRIGMPHHQFARSLDRLPAYPDEEAWAALPEGGGLVPVPASETHWRSSSGITTGPAPDAPVGLSALTAEHYCLRDWYAERDARPWRHVLLNADWSTALLTAYFKPDGALARIRVGPTIGMSGHVYRGVYELSE